MLHVRAARVGQDTTLAQIVALVESAQLAKAPIQAFADHVCAVFVPVVVILAVATWNAWCALAMSLRITHALVLLSGHRMSPSSLRVAVRSKLNNTGWILAALRRCGCVL